MCETARRCRTPLNGQLRERQCWIALFNSVYDFSSFVREHPGGAAALRALAGSDGSEAYERVHPRRLLEAVGEGEQRLSLRELRELNARASGDGAAALAAFARQPLLPLPQLRVGTLMPADPAALPLPSPFPHADWEGSGALAGRLICCDAPLFIIGGNGSGGGPNQSLDDNHRLLRHRSGLTPLPHTRHWLHVSACAKTYARTMRTRHALLLGSGDGNVPGSGSDGAGGQQQQQQQQQ